MAEQRIVQTTPLDVSQMSIPEIMALPDSELGPVLSRGHWDLFQQLMHERDLAEAIEAVRYGHWAPGLPTKLGGGSEKADSIGL